MAGTAGARPSTWSSGLKAAAPIAVDAMGGDQPEAVVAGACQAAAELGLAVVLVGQPELLEDAGGLEVWPAGEVIDMTDDPAQSVRRKKDASMVRAAEAVRDGRAAAMVSAGNTGAVMASALLRMGRISGVQRPAIATLLPVANTTPTVLLDSGANAECTPQWLVQFAQMGAVFFAERFGISRPRVALLSIGEEPSKGTALVKEAHVLLSEPGCLAGAGQGGTFLGNVEGRDILTDAVDVIVTDGFTGNVVLKALEGGVGYVVERFVEAITSTDEARAAARALTPVLAPLHEQLDPDTYGGAMLLGVDGVCIVSHGSSSPRAIANAIRMAADMAAAGLVARLEQAVQSSPFTSAQSRG